MDVRRFNWGYGTASEATLERIGQNGACAALHEPVVTRLGVVRLPRVEPGSARWLAALRIGLDRTGTRLEGAAPSR